MNRSWFTGLCLVVLLLPVTGVNGEILRVSADQVNLRSAPSLSAPIQRQLFRSNLVTILARGATELEIQGKRGKWVRVSVLDCSDFNCSAGSQGNQTGWMFDAFLDPRPFMRVTSWHGSFYNGCVGDYCISYRVGSDGRCTPNRLALTEIAARTRPQIVVITEAKSSSWPPTNVMGQACSFRAENWFALFRICLIGLSVLRSFGASGFLSFGVKSRL